MMMLLPWNCWELIFNDYVSLSPSDLSLLDRLADLTEGDVPDFDSVRQLYESNPRLRVGDSVQSYVNGQMVAIELG